MAKKSTKTGLGLQGILTIMFFIAKATGYIDWSWWWVFAPLWVPFAIFASIIGTIFIASLIITIFE